MQSLHQTKRLLLLCALYAHFLFVKLTQVTNQFTAAFFLGGEFSPFGDNIFKREYSVTNPCLILILYFHILILPNLAKYTLGWLPVGITKLGEKKDWRDCYQLGLIYYIQKIHITRLYVPWPLGEQSLVAIVGSFDIWYQSRTILISYFTMTIYLHWNGTSCLNTYM